MRAGYAIVGGGVMGTALAMRLATRTDSLSAPVVLFERTALAAGSSGRSGSILRQIYADAELCSMARDSLRVYAGFETHTGRAIGFRRTGVLTIAGPKRPAELERLPRLAETMRSVGIDVRTVGADEIREISGAEVDARCVGLWEPSGGFVDPVRTVNEFAALARSSGAVTRLGVLVHSIEVRGGRVVGVETGEGSYSTERVVVMAGPWSRELLARAGVELPLRVVRPEQHFQRMPPSDDTDAADDADHPSALLDPMGRLLDENSGPDPRTGVPHPVIIDLENEFYTRCDPPHGRTRVGRTDYSHDREVPDPDRLDEAVSADFGTWAESVLRRRLPIYRELPALGAQAAWYTLTPDAQALIGPIEGIEGLFVATGFSGHGFKLAPSVAAGLVQMLLGETVTAFSPSFFDPRRFAGKQLTWGGALGL